MSNSMNTLNEQELENVAGGVITQEEALAAALEHAQLKKEQLDFLKRVELDYDHGRKVYEINFYQGGFEYDYDVDAETGAILKFEKDFD